MADPLALYASVMGRLWEDERIRGQPQRGSTPGWRAVGRGGVSRGWGRCRRETR